MTQASAKDKREPRIPDRLEQAIALIADGIAILDELGLSAAASHASHGHELARKELDLLRNEGSSVA